MDADTNYFNITKPLSWKEIAQRVKDQDITAADELLTSEDEAAQVHQWGTMPQHGQLALDIYQTAADLIVEAPIAGVLPEDLDISIQDDILTIKGHRRRCQEIEEDNLIYQECHWGDFSRSVILPMDVVSERIEASLKNGVLTIRLPKAQPNRSIRVKLEG